MALPIDSNKYYTAHYWIYSKSGKAKYCSKDSSHQSKRFEWANISREYKKELNDWIQLCSSCHRKMDITDVTRVKQAENARRNKNSSRKIAQYSISGAFIKAYQSGAEAARQLGMCKTAINNMLKGRAKTAGGYIWIYR